MTEERVEPTPEFAASLMRGMTSRRTSRRNMMKYMGMSVGALSLSSILAACGGDDDTPTGGGTDTGTGSGNMPDYGATPGDTLNFANWPLYIDKAREDNQTIYPSLVEFTNDTGITVNYEDVINDNAAFVATLIPQLSSGQSTGWDVIVVTNGREFETLKQNQWVYDLDPTRRPNFDANAASWAKDPGFDPGNKISMCWQSGLSAIGYNTELVNGEITKLDDLMNPDIVGNNLVGVLKSEIPDIAMINLGIDPGTSGPEEWQEAADWIQKLKDSGTVRQWYDQGYVDDLTAGNLSASIAWSGDVLYYKIWEDYPFEFVVPEGGAMIWIDNMLIPVNAENPAGAMMMMDHFYRPEIAQMVTEWVLYMSPVPAVQDLIAKHADEVKDEGYAEDLTLTAESPLLWPDDELLSQVKFARNLTTQEERDAWDAIFVPIFEGA
jgi:spermidine/putrescine transport system substrate-binding protein